MDWVRLRKFMESSGAQCVDIADFLWCFTNDVVRGRIRANPDCDADRRPHPQK